MPFTDMMGQIHSALSHVFPDDVLTAVYYPTDGSPGVPVRVFLEREVARYPESLAAAANERFSEIELLLADVPAPARDAIVTLAGTSYRLVERIEQNSYRASWAVKRAEL